MPHDPLVRVGVGAVIIDTLTDSLLMVRRIHHHGANTWSVPGGWQNHDETPAETAVRETREETGIVTNLAAATYIGITDTDFRGDGGFRATTWFVHLPVWSGEPENIEPDKHSQVDWVSRSHLYHMPLFTPLVQFLNHRIGEPQPWRPTTTT